MGLECALIFVALVKIMWRPMAPDAKVGAI